MALRVTKTFRTGNLFADKYRVKNGANGIGAEYCISGLYTFLCSSNSPADEISSPILEDLEHYRRYCEERKKIWKGRGSRQSKLEAINALRDKIVESRLAERL